VRLIVMAAYGFRRGSAFAQDPVKVDQALHGGVREDSGCSISSARVRSR